MCVCMYMGVPSSLPVLPPGAQGWNQRPLRAKEKQGSHRQDTAITGKLVSNSSRPASVCFVCKGLNAEPCLSVQQAGAISLKLQADRAGVHTLTSQLQVQTQGFACPRCALYT